MPFVVLSPHIPVGIHIYDFCPGIVHGIIEDLDGIHTTCGIYPLPKALRVRDGIVRIDRHSEIEEERPAKRYISKRSISGRYIWERSVTIPRRSITHGSTDRKKVLQTGALMRVWVMRSMRALFCRSWRQKIVLLAVLASSANRMGDWRTHSALWFHA
jgi:hypothetical protein